MRADPLLAGRYVQLVKSTPLADRTLVVNLDSEEISLKAVAFTPISSIDDSTEASTSAHQLPLLVIPRTNPYATA